MGAEDSDHAGEKVVNAWRMGDSIYVTTTDANVARINATEGTLKWQIELRDREYHIFRPADVPGSKESPEGKYVLIVNRGRAYTVEKQTGDVAMQKPMQIAVTTDPIIAKEAFCVGAVNYFRRDLWTY